MSEQKKPEIRNAGSGAIANEEGIAGGENSAVIGGNVKGSVTIDNRVESRTAMRYAVIAITSVAIVAIIGSIFSSYFASQAPVISPITTVLSPTSSSISDETSNLIISDVIVYSKGDGNYEVDFRVVNKGTTEILINHVLFEDIQIYGTVSGIPYSDVTGPADICSYYLKNEPLKQSIAVKVEAGKVDRLGALLTCGWTDWGKTLYAKVSLETSDGIASYDEGLELWLGPLSDQEKKMIDAVESGNAQEVRALLDLYPNLHSIDELPHDILYIAAGNGEKEIVKLLLDRIPKPIDANRLESAAGITVERGDVDILRLFLESDLNPNARQMIEAKCWKETADDLINANGKIETYVMANMHRNCQGWNRFPENMLGVSLLHKAAYYGHKDVILLLLSFGADISTKDENQQTPKDYALEKDHAELYQILDTEK